MFCHAGVGISLRRRWTFLSALSLFVVISFVFVVAAVAVAAVAVTAVL
jgi:hypothetical protein